MTMVSIHGDGSVYRVGDYAILNNVWGKGSLVNGVDYSQTLQFDTHDLTHAVTMSWSWPDNGGLVAAYPEIIFGDSPFAEGDGKDYAFSARIDDLKSFRVDVDMDLAQGSSFRDVAFDIWLTDTPFGNIATTHSEVMICLDMDDTQPWGQKVGVYGKGNDTASIYYAPASGSGWDYIAVVFDKPHLKADIDIRAVLMDLAERGIVEGDDYVSGYQLGAEISSGKGSLVINSVEDDIESFAATDGADRLVGTATHDTIHALDGDDTVRAGHGKDLVDGGTGHDRLFGGAGADTFLFAATGAENVDIIQGFVSGKDSIRLDATVFTGAGLGVLGDEAFSSGSGVTADTRIICDAKSGVLSFDADGAGENYQAIDFAIVKHADLHASDFFLG